MKIHLESNVFEEAIKRLNWLFDEFENIVVAFSGGKDSTVILNLALIIAKEKNRLPLKVMFIDQEAEWNAVVEYIRRTFSRKEIEPYWLQVPIRLFNATSMDEAFLNCWNQGEEWMREKEPDSIKDTDYGTDRFHPMFPAFLKHHFPDTSVAMLGGVRAEESPNRRTGLTDKATYKHITYGKVYDKKKGHYTFNFIYDWSWRDIWKAIHDNKWDYCEIYDEFYRWGISPMKMRVSNLHHETAVDQLYYLHEMESDTWNALTKRLNGINQTKHISKKDMFRVTDLPYMFESWREYRDYLLEHLVKDSLKPIYVKKFAKMDIDYEGIAMPEEMYKEQIMTILTNDYHFTKLANWQGRPHTINFRKFKKGKFVNFNRPEKDLKYIKREERYANESPNK